MATKICSLDQLNNLLQRNKLIPVLFTAEWSKPSLSAGFLLDESCMVTGAAAVQVDIDKGCEVAQAFDIETVPVLLLVGGGRVVVDKRRGVMDTHVSDIMRIAAARQK